MGFSFKAQHIAVAIFLKGCSNSSLQLTGSSTQSETNLYSLALGRNSAHKICPRIHQVAKEFNRFLWVREKI